MLSFSDARLRLFAVDETTEIETTPLLMARGRALGEDVAGVAALKAGTVLAPTQIGMLANFGMDEVPVHDPVAVAFVGIVDEEDDSQVTPQYQRLNEATQAVLVAACQRSEMIPLDLGLVPEKAELFNAALHRGLETAHIFCTIGAPNAGGLDMAKKVIAERGGKFYFDGVAQQPCNQLCCAELEEGWWFGLPAEPMAALTCYELYVRPFSYKLAGYAAYDLKQMQGCFTEPQQRHPQATSLIYVQLAWRDGAYRLYTSGGVDNKPNETTPTGYGIAVLAAGDQALPAGEMVPVFLTE